MLNTLQSKLTITMLGLLSVPLIAGWIYLIARGGSRELLWVSLVTAVVAALAGYRAIKHCAEPIAELTRRVEALARGREYEPVKLERGDELDQLGAALNRVGERMQATIQEAAAERARLSAVLANLLSGVILTNAEGTVVLANQAAQRLLSVRQDPVGRNHRYVHRNYELGAALERVRRTGERADREVILYQPEELHLQVTLLPLSVADRPGVLAVLHDVTETRRLQQLKANLIADVSHELKTPVTAIRGFAETLLGGALERREAAERFLTIIESEAERLERLIEDLLKLSLLESRGVAFEERCVEMAKIVESVAARFAGRAQENDVALKTVIEEGQHLALGDPHYLEQAVANLVDNALKYTDEGGQVILNLKDVPAELIELVVEDTGSGIPEEDLPHVFHRFFRVERARSRKEGGTGLGLAIVKHIISAHNGEVGAESELGRGSRFWVRLPRYEQEEAAQIDPEPAPH